jgi:Ras-related protein Rab-21
MEYKVVVLGDKGVGKTCLVLRFIEGYFMAKQQSTVGAFFLTKKVTLPDGTSVKLQIWDTAGQERFRAMAPVRKNKCVFSGLKLALCVICCLRNL